MQRMLNVTFSIFFFLVILAIVICSLVVKNTGGVLEGADREFTEMLKYIAMLIFLLHVPVAYILPQKSVKKIDKDVSLNEKLVLYHKAMVLRYALLSSAVIFVCIVFCLIVDTNLIYIAAMGLVFFLIGKPNPFKTASDLGLTDEEKQQLFGGN